MEEVPKGDPNNIPQLLLKRIQNPLLNQITQSSRLPSNSRPVLIHKRLLNLFPPASHKPPIVGHLMQLAFRHLKKVVEVQDALLKQELCDVRDGVAQHIVSMHIVESWTVLDEAPRHQSPDSSFGVGAGACATRSAGRYFNFFEELQRAFQAPFCMPLQSGKWKLGAWTYHGRSGEACEPFWTMGLPV